MTVETTIDYSIASAVPTLKVMRIQSPQLSKTQTPKSTSPHLSSSLILPDSFGVIHIGETFTAYLGAINTSTSVPITNLSVSSVLQTPTTKLQLSSVLDKTQPTNEQERQNFRPLHIEPQGGVDAIISVPLEEIGQHLLRVDVSYGGTDPTIAPPPRESLNQNDPMNQQQQQQNNYHTRKTLRKFYRFHVSSPLHMKELTLRGGESSCFLSLAVENAATINESKGGGLTIAQTEFQPYTGLIAEPINCDSSVLNAYNKNSNINDDDNDTNYNSIKKKSAVELFDECGRLEPGESKRYLFKVKAASDDAALRGIAKGDELGRAIVTWRKSMGEAGRIASTFLRCPPSDVGKAIEEREAMKMKKVTMNQKYVKNKSLLDGDDDDDELHTLDDGLEDRFVVHGSGLSVDVAACAAEQSAALHSPSNKNSIKSLDAIFPVTVEPIDPPSRMVIGKPVKVQLLVVNHGTKAQNLQLQLRLVSMKGVVVSGQSFQNLGEIGPDGGSDIATVTFVAVARGLFHVTGCCIVNLNTGIEVKQPALFSVFVD